MAHLTFNSNAGAQQADIADLTKRIEKLEASGDYAGMLSGATSLQSAVEATFGISHPAYAAALYFSGIAYSKLEKPAEAEAHFKRAIELSDHAGRFDPLLTARFIHGLALFYYDQSRYDEAELFYKRELSILERTANTPAMMQSLFGMSSVHAVRGRFDEAKPFQDRAEEILRKGIREEHVAFSEFLDIACDVAVGLRRKYLEDLLARIDKRLVLTARADSKSTQELCVMIKEELLNTVNHRIVGILIEEKQCLPEQALDQLRKEMRIDTDPFHKTYCKDGQLQYSGQIDSILVAPLPQPSVPPPPPPLPFELTPTAPSVQWDTPGTKQILPRPSGQ